MNKATIAESVIALGSGALAASLANRLHTYGVPITALIAVFAFTLVTGLSLANAIGQAMRTSYFACPTKGCTVSIRARGTDAAELGRLRVLATDHSKHGSSR